MKFTNFWLCKQKYLLKSSISLLQYMKKFRAANRNWKLELLFNVCRKSIGDEFHYIFERPSFNGKKRFSARPNYLKKHDTLSIDLLMNTYPDVFPDYKRKEIILRLKMNQILYFLYCYIEVGYVL